MADEKEDAKHPPWVKTGIYVVREIGFMGAFLLVLLVLGLRHVPGMADAWTDNLSAQTKALEALEKSIESVDGTLYRIDRAEERSEMNYAKLKALEIRITALEAGDK